MFWVTDLGWLMGPLLITGTLLLGGTVLLFEGTPDYPQPDRLWALCERHRITHLGISPTAVRALMPHGSEWVTRHDLSALRIIGSTGEPWNPEPYRWLFEHVEGESVICFAVLRPGQAVSDTLLFARPISVETRQTSRPWKIPVVSRRSPRRFKR